MNLLLSPLLRGLLFCCISLQLLYGVTFTSVEKEWMTSHPVITLGSDFSWPPYDFADKDGIYTEISEDFLALISKEKKNIRDKWMPVSYKSKIDYTLVYQILAIFFFFIVGTWFWYKKVTIEVKKRKESEMQMSMLIDAIPLSVIVSNFSGEVLRANRFALETFNVTADEMSQYNVKSFYTDSSERDKMMQMIKRKGKVVDEIVKFHRSDGREMNVMMSIMPIVYDGEKALLSIMVDLTERIEMEEHLREAKQVAERANKSKSAFLANMSHEIRTPMNAIMGFTELLNEQIKTPRLKSYTNIIKNAGTTLLTLINDILDLSKIEAGKLEIHKTAVDVYGLAEEIVSMFSIIASQKGLSIILDIDKEMPQSLVLDGIRLRQILVNLMGNAVKFTEEGYVKLSIHAFNLDEQHLKLDLEISVADTGVGISEDQRERIFLSFEQQEGQDNRKFGGTGLGLSISKRLAEMMDGTIMVQSEEKRGATFFLYLYGVDISSMIDAESTEEKTIDNRKIVFSPAKILIVDDIEDNRALILSMFEESSIETITASDGLEAVNALKMHKPDLILMDIRMPKMDGYEAARQIREISDVPIIALTASVMKDAYERSQSEAFNGYLQKPILKETLLSELSHYLSYTYETAKFEEYGALDDNVWKHINKEDREAIKEYLELTVTPLYEVAQQSNNISEIEQFNTAIKTLTDQYEIESLKMYTVQLTEAIDTFDIVSIKSLLQRYITLASRFI